MTGSVEFLDTDDLIELARRLLGDPPPVRDVGLLTGRGARPQASAFGSDAYPDIWTKAAALLQSSSTTTPSSTAQAPGMARNSGVPRTQRSLRDSGHNDDVYELVMSVAAAEGSVEEIADLLRELSPPSRPSSDN